MRVGRFATVGAMNTAVDFVLFNVLALLFGVHVAVANVVSYSAGIANSYVWSRYWTFSDRRSVSWGPESVRFVIANLGGLAVNTSIVWALVALHEGLSGADTPLLPAGLLLPGAKAVAVLGSMVFNYVVFSSWVFPQAGGRDER